jgi:hypothetical protein
MAALSFSGGFASAQEADPQSGVSAQAAVDTAFTYQGYLEEDGSPANGEYDFEFNIYNQESGGSVVFGPWNLEDETVSDGYFTVPIDVLAPDAVFDGGERWLEVGVRPGSSIGSYTYLTPLQPLRPTPYAFSLWPGAKIAGENGAADGVLNVWNTGLGSGQTAIYGWAQSGVNTNYGVYGQSNSVNGRGVYGLSSATDGSFGFGVFGQSKGDGGRGVYGRASSSTGETYGVYGWSQSTSGKGVYGLANATTGTTYGVYGQSESSTGVGVYGKAPSIGVWGTAEAYDGATYGVYGSSRSTDGFAMFGSSTNGGYAGFFAGDESGVASNLDAHVAVVRNNGSSGPDMLALQAGLVADPGAGTNYVTFFDLNGAIAAIEGNGSGGVTYRTSGADFAEMLPAQEGVEPTDVLVIGPDGRLVRSTESYQATVVGVYSSAPGFIGGATTEDEPPNGEVPLAVVGVVPVKASAENGAIQPGDLLVASNTPGHAMVAGADPPQGTVIGKALGRLEDGTGIVKILVMLQ